MALDLGKTILQLDQSSHNLKQTYNDRQSRLAALIQQADEIETETAREMTSGAASRPYMAAQADMFTGGLSGVATAVGKAFGSGMYGSLADYGLTLSSAMPPTSCIVFANALTLAMTSGRITS